MQDRIKPSRTSPSSTPPEELPYLIEVRQAADGETVEHVLARAASSQLARAIFTAAKGEHPGQRIVLRKGSSIIADSSA